MFVYLLYYFSVCPVQSLSCVRLFATRWTAACLASLSITNSWSLPKLMPIESVMPSNHLIFCCPLLLLPSIFPNIKVFSNESALCIRWPKYWSFSFNISPSNEHPGLISFRMDCLDLLAVRPLFFYTWSKLQFTHFLFVPGVEFHPSIDFFNQDHIYIYFFHFQDFQCIFVFVSLLGSLSDCFWFHKLGVVIFLLYLFEGFDTCILESFSVCRVFIFSRLSFSDCWVFVSPSWS